MYSFLNPTVQTKKLEPPKKGFFNILPYVCRKRLMKIAISKNLKILVNA